MNITISLNEQAEVALEGMCDFFGLDNDHLIEMAIMHLADQAMLIDMREQRLVKYVDRLSPDVPPHQSN